MRIFTPAMKPTHTNTFWLVPLGLCLILSCASEPSHELQPFPSTDRMALTWEVLDDAITGDDKRTLQFSLRNDSDTLLPRSDWKLYFNQFPHALYIDESYTNDYQVTNEGGDLYSIAPRDSFPGLGQGESFIFRYQTNFGIFRYTFGPQNPFFVVGDDLVLPITSFSKKTFSENFTTTRGTEEKSIYMSPQERFEYNAGILAQTRDEQAIIIPEPAAVELKPETLTLHSTINIFHDEGLEDDAEYISTLLNGMLTPPSPEGPSRDTVEIYLRIGSVGTEGNNAEAYTLDIDTGSGIEIVGADRAGVFYAVQTLEAMIDPANLGVVSDSLILPGVLIKDRPRFEYRGLMLDLARNFNGLDQVYKIVRLMARYKMNKLHLHLTDDEGWRLQIPGLEELTQIGATRGLEDPETQLPPAYGSGGKPGLAPGSGYLTRNEFIELLQYAQARNIEIITELNGPGHARAAIRAMQARNANLSSRGQDETGEFVLHDPEDKSRYSSAQGYHDNVMCVCRESVYAFWDKIVGELVAMYEEADVPLSILHTGSDEVPRGAWTESPICQKLIRENDELESADDLHTYFLRRLNQILDSHNLRLAGWEEIALHTAAASDEELINDEFVSADFVPYVWNSIVGSRGEDVGYRLANAGYDVVLCNATNLYLDMSYTYEPEEPGLSWAGFVDTRNAFEYTPFNLFKTMFADDYGKPMDPQAMMQSKVALDPSAEERVLGIQAQLWSETFSNPDLVEYSMLPKLLAVAERAWAKAPAWAAASSNAQTLLALNKAWTRFARRVGSVELSRLDQMDGGYFYRIPPPGARIVNGRLEANSTFPGAIIRYTTDGTEPNPFSPLYEEPIAVSGNNEILLRSFTTTNRASRLVKLDPEGTLK